MRRFVALDRDGTLIVERHYLSDPGGVELLPGAAGALRRLRHLGLGLIVVTNQSGVGRGYFSREQLERIHERLGELLAAEGIVLDGIYVCPHTPADGCACRKPEIGMLRQAAHELGFDPTASFVVGDNVGDVEMGRRVGATTFLVQTGYGTQVAREGRVQPDHVVDDLRDVAAIIEGLIAGEATMDEEQEAGWRHERMRSHLLESAEVTRRVAESCAESILVAATLMAHTFQAGGKVLLCGNGGSAADCQHMAAELVSRLTPDFVRPGLPALALTTDTSYLTAFANDCGFDDVFARQVQALGRPGDLLVGISTSGNSVNVIRAVEAARQGGVRTLTLTGSAGRLPQLGDVAIAVPSTTTQYIQEAHLVVEHILCDLVERSLFAGSAEPQRGDSA